MAGRYALLIGNSTFDDPSLARLAAPEADVIALRDVLSNPDIGGFEVDLSLNAGMDEVRTAIAAHFDNRDRDDLVLLYYTGHGLRDEHGALFLALPKTQAISPHAISIEASYIRGAMDRSASRRQVLILDCCHSGAFASGFSAKRGTDAPTLVKTDFEETGGHGRFILAASAADESAFEQDGSSLFTRFIVEALKTGGAAPGAKSIAINDLHAYVACRVGETTAPMKPRLWADEQTAPLILARNPDPREPLPPELVADLWGDDQKAAHLSAILLGEIVEGDDAQLADDARKVLNQRLEKEETLSFRVGNAIRQALEPKPTTALGVEPDLEKAKALARLRSRRRTVRVLAAGTLAVLLAAGSAYYGRQHIDRGFEAAGLGFLAQPADADAHRAQVQAELKAAALRGELDTVRGSVTELRRQLDQAKAERGEALAEVERLQESETALAEQIDALKLSSSEMQAELSRALADNTDLEEKLVDAQAGREEAEDRAQKLHIYVERLMARIAELEATEEVAAAHDPLSTFSDCTDCPEMVVIPGGTFRMGSPRSEEGHRDREGPQREVTVAPFALATHEVRLSDFATFVQATGYRTDGGCYTWDLEASEWTQQPDASWRAPGFETGQSPSEPVVCVSWEDAQAYVAWLSDRTGERYRLPSEAEWEYAARAGTTTPFWTGATISTDQANYNGNYVYGSGVKGVWRGQTTPVDAFAANPWGLHDMHGNVWEWVEDCWHDGYAGAPVDGSAWLESEGGDCSLRVLRGGSWGRLPRYLRSASRVRSNPDDRIYDYGFRVARTLTP